MQLGAVERCSPSLLVIAVDRQRLTQQCQTRTPNVFRQTLAPHNEVRISLLPTLFERVLCVKVHAHSLYPGPEQYQIIRIGFTQIL